MIDINKFNQSLKVSWIQKYLDPTNDGKWKFVFEDSLKKHGGRDIFTCNLHKDDTPTLGVCNPFVQEVLEAWAELHFTDVTDITDVNVGDQIIWYNSLIRINDRPVFHKHWLNHRICKISHLLDENGTLLRYDELRIKFPELKWFELFAVLSAIRSFIRKLHNPQTPDKNIMKGVSLADLTSKSKINHFVYTSLLKREKIPPIGSQVKWLRDLHVQNDCEVDWKVAYTIAFNCTASTKLRTFHFKFLHRRIATNDFLQRINLIPSNKCFFCAKETETIVHLFLNCPITQCFWEDIKQFLFQKGFGTEFVLTDLHLMGLSRIPTNTAVDLVLLIARYHLLPEIRRSASLFVCFLE
ncbi:hypothetical protein ACROYT_G013871 [Oculina patagonica]